MLRKRLKFFIIIGAITSAVLVFLYFSNVPSVKADDPNLIKELLFTVENSEGDAIGVKVMKNPQRLPPLLWYNQNVSNPASPSYFAIDNYYALRDGRTVYVGAPNVDTSNYNISSYIYIFSYNEGASPETINIFNQLLNNWIFNINIEDPTHKLQLQRDLLRIYDISEIQNSLSNYYETKGHYPTLISGSYIIGKTYTTWPSWQYTLSSELGQSLPVDPINRFNGPCSDCPDNPNQPDYQCNGTCYNPTIMPPNISFTHPNGSHVYQYSTSDDDLCAGQGYSLFANLEYKPTADNVIWLGELEEENIIISQEDNAGTHNYTFSEGAGECGDNIKDACEECEIVDGSIVPENMTCANLGLGYGTLTCDNCHWSGCGMLADGQVCDFDSECLSGHCSHDVCCNTACEGLCQDCSGGTCHLVAAGDDPRNVCADTECATGDCDGSGACELKPTGISCGICKYCSVSGQCLNTSSGEDYNNQCTDDPANCQAGYCDGYGECAYYPEGFVCGDCKKCDIQHSCGLVPEGTNWGFNYICDYNNPPDIFACYDNWGDCDSDLLSNGCETNLLTDINNCGSCGNDCKDNQSCILGICECNAGWGDCDCDGDSMVCSDSTWQVCEIDDDCPTGETCENNPSYYVTTGDDLNGCETSLLSNDTNCGACGYACENNTECDDSGECVCQQGWGDCFLTIDGCETHLLSDDENCGECGHMCDIINDYMCCGGECVLNDYAGIYPADNDQWDFTQDQFHIDISIESCLEGEGCYHNDSGGYNSIFIHQDANEPYPGICNQDNCMGGSDPRVGVWPESYAYGTNSGSTSWRCIWETDGPWVTGGPSNRCFFADDPSTIPACKFSSKGTPDACDAYEGEGFPWPVTNRVMWGKAVCDTSGFGLEPGKEYIFSFYYKGNISGDYNSAMIQMAYNLGWSSQSRSCQECQNNGSCNPSCPIDFNDPDDPCGKCRFVNYPYQTAPYPHIDLGSIPSGNYPDWQRYVTSFTYTDEMNRLFDSNGNLHHEMGFTMPYRNIGDGGTNLYIDDVQFKSCPVLP